MMRITGWIAATLAVWIAVGTANAASEDEGARRFREIYKELVETNTTLSAGDCTLAAKRMAARLKAAGYPDEDVRIFVPGVIPRKVGCWQCCTVQIPGPKPF